MESPHRESLMSRPECDGRVRPLSSKEVHDIERAKNHERMTWEMEHARADAVNHRLAPSHRKERMSSWVADKSSAQADFEANKARKAAKNKGSKATTHTVDDKRYTRADGEKMRKFENQKMHDNHVRKTQRGTAGEIDYAGMTPAERVAHKDWDDAVRQNRTEARKVELMRSANIDPHKMNHVECHSTHRHQGHLTECEANEYGLIAGETLDEEGRVVPPWAGRSEKYVGPKGEHEVQYPYDYGYGPRGFVEASRGKVPPPQLHLKDKGAAPRRDPDLYNDVAPYLPYGQAPPAPYGHPALGYGAPHGPYGEPFGYGYGYGTPALALGPGPY